MELRILKNLQINDLFINIGTDIVENKRIEKNIQNYKFINRILNEKELELFKNIKNLRRRVEFLAGRFSAKESITKALNYKPNFNEIYIKDTIVEISLSMQKVIEEKLKLNNLLINVSISHERNYTISFCIVRGVKNE